MTPDFEIPTSGASEDPDRVRRLEIVERWREKGLLSKLWKLLLVRAQYEKDGMPNPPPITNEEFPGIKNAGSLRDIARSIAGVNRDP